MKVVINRCYGGFGVSPEAMKRLIELDSKVIKVYDPKEYYGGNNPNFADRDWKADYDREFAAANDVGGGYRAQRFGGVLFKDGRVFTSERDDHLRSDPALVRVVEEMGDKANGECASLAVVTIPDDVTFEIEEYDGIEWVAEEHRTWR